MDIQNILKNSSLELKKAGSPTAETDARMILEFSLSKSREYLTAHPYEPLTNSDYSRYRRLVRRRIKGEPIAYITKQKEFYGYDFYVNKNVLVPRPESEMLIENSLSFLESRIKPCLPVIDSEAQTRGAGKNYELSKKTSPTICPQLSILDIGTGSGCLIISLIKEINKLDLRPTTYDLRYFASEISLKALYVARKNAKHHKVNKLIRFFHSDLFSNSRMPKKYDLIIANLPYVPNNSERRKVTEGHPELACPPNWRVSGSRGLLNSKWKNPISYEPNDSIFTDDNGAKIIKKFIDQVEDKINENGLILIEADLRNIENISIYAKNQIKNSTIEIIKDLAGNKRVLKILT